MATLPFTQRSLLALVFAPLLCLAVSVNYPLEDQLPQIARVGQPFSWSFSPITFDDGSAGPLQYTAYSIPAWLSFDPPTRTFSGTPGTNDEGRPQVRVEAEDTEGDTDSSVLTLCVTPYSPPVLNRPISQQFVEGNPSLSSVFLLSPNSALAQDPKTPTLRVPSSWSFSIGFEYDTFGNKSNVYYDARQADGSPLPSWMRFSTKGLTVDGVVPHEDALATPATFYLALHASDQEGFSAETLPFNLVVASHELSLGPGMSSLPTINVTAGEDFDIALASALDYNGALFDGSQIQPDNVTIFDVDTSSAPGLAYDKVTHRLKGKAPSNTTTLPVSLEANGQTLNSTLQIMSVASFFTHDNLGSASTEEGGKLSFDLEPFLTDKGISEDVDLSISLSPVEAGSWLSFSNSSRILSGTAPKSDPGYESVGVTFTAYSHDTHSTSHARLSVALEGVVENGKGAGGSHAAASEKRGKIVSILTIVFGVLGGMLGLGLLIAALSRCARVPDTALGPEQALQSFTEKERSYYGLSRDAETGNSGFGDSRAGSQSDMSLSNSYVHPETDLPQPPEPAYAAARYGNIGVGYPLDSPASSVMTKANFMERVRTAARNVSDKARRVSGRRPNISLPMPVQSDPEQGTPTIAPIGGPAFFGDPGSDVDSPSFGGATPIISQSSTPASGFAARRIRDSRGETLSQVRRFSSGSVNSLASLRTHEETAIVHKAQRATSIRNMSSGLTASSVRNIDPEARMMPGPSTRGQAPFSPTQNGLRTGRIGTRPISQVASVQNAQADDLETSMAYVNAYSGRESVSTKRASTTYTTMSFSAGESPSMSSSRAESRAGGGRVDKVVSPGGQMVVTLRLTAEGARAQERNALRVQQIDGERLPEFIRAELKARPGHPGEVVIRAMPPVDCSEELVAVAVYDSKNNIVSNEVRFEISQEI